MLHPFMTQELVRQRRAALDAESRSERLGRNSQFRTRADPERGRLAAVAQTFARQLRASGLAPPDPATGGTVMTIRLERPEPGAITTDRSRANLIGTWSVDPAHSIVSFRWHTLRLRTVTGRSDCSGLIHLDELPPVGVIRFEQQSSLPVLAISLDPASLDNGAADPNPPAVGPCVGAIRRQRSWTLYSPSLEILPSGLWRLMATLTAHETLGLVELRLAVDPKASGRDWLVLRGRGMLDRRAFATGRWASSLDPTIRLELAVRARRVAIHRSTNGHEGDIDRRPSVTAEEHARRGQRAR